MPCGNTQPESRMSAVSARRKNLACNACDVMWLNVLGVVQNSVDAGGQHFVSRFEFIT